MQPMLEAGSERKLGCGEYENRGVRVAGGLCGDLGTETSSTRHLQQLGRRSLRDLSGRLRRMCNYDTHLLVQKVLTTVPRSQILRSEPLWCAALAIKKNILSERLAKTIVRMQLDTHIPTHSVPAAVILELVLHVRDCTGPPSAVLPGPRTAAPVQVKQTT